MEEKWMELELYIAYFKKKTDSDAEGLDLIWYIEKKMNRQNN